jgi:hypothetical protein
MAVALDRPVATAVLEDQLEDPPRHSGNRLEQPRIHRVGIARGILAFDVEACPPRGRGTIGIDERTLGHGNGEVSPIIGVLKTLPRRCRLSSNWS